ncbi:hypothetical protein EON63_11755, partial [archaeon]
MYSYYITPRTLCTIQGEAGSYYYIIASGTYSVLVDNKKVKERHTHLHPTSYTIHHTSYTIHHTGDHPGERWELR